MTRVLLVWEGDGGVVEGKGEFGQEFYITIFQYLFYSTLKSFYIFRSIMFKNS